MVAPYANSQRNAIAGRLTKNTAGNATSVKRNAPRSMGGTPCRPTLITTKFTPQARMTISADNKSLGDIAVSVSFIRSCFQDQAGDRKLRIQIERNSTL